MEKARRNSIEGVLAADGHRDEVSGERHRLPPAPTTSAGSTPHAAKVEHLRVGLHRDCRADGGHGSDLATGGTWGARVGLQRMHIQRARLDSLDPLHGRRESRDGGDAGNAAGNRRRPDLITVDPRPDAEGVLTIRRSPRSGWPRWWCPAHRGAPS